MVTRVSGVSTTLVLAMAEVIFFLPLFASHQNNTFLLLFTLQSCLLRRLRSLNFIILHAINACKYKHYIILVSLTQKFCIKCQTLRFIRSNIPTNLLILHPKNALGDLLHSIRYAYKIDYLYICFQSTSPSYIRTTCDRSYLEYNRVRYTIYT